MTRAEWHQGNLSRTYYRHSADADPFDGRPYWTQHLSGDGDGWHLHARWNHLACAPGLEQRYDSEEEARSAADAQIDDLHRHLQPPVATAGDSMGRGVATAGERGPARVGAAMTPEQVTDAIESALLEAGVPVKRLRTNLVATAHDEKYLHGAGGRKQYACWVENGALTIGIKTEIAYVVRLDDPDPIADLRRAIPGLKLVHVGDKRREAAALDELENPR